jgi:protein-S-isoprenylcysteine O-methyltransferase Ste14
MNIKVVTALKGQELSIDRDVDRMLALAFFALVIVSLYSAYNKSEPLVKLELLGSIPLNVLASISFLTRGSVREGTHRNEITVPALSFTIPFLVTNNILLIPKEYSIWFGLLIALPGMLLACYSMIVLRRSFSILPAVRTITSSGPYRFVRHPLYLGESIYLLGIMLLAFNLLSITLLGLSFVLLVQRIRIEEHKLGSYWEYQEYMSKVRFRLIPGLF